MKKSIIAFFLFLSLSVASFAQDLSITQIDSVAGDWIQGGMSEGSILVCMGDKVNVRDKDDLKAKTIGSIQYGEKVEVLLEAPADGEEFTDYGGKAWLKIRTMPKSGKPVEGYVYSSFLARGAWELKEGRNKTLITLGLPYGPTEKHSPVILRLRGARNMDIPYHPDQKPGEKTTSTDYSLSSISLDYEAGAIMLEDGELLLWVTDMQCACGCYGKQSYFLVGNVDKGFPIMTGELGNNEGYRKTVYPMLEDHRIIGFMQEEAMNEHQSGLGSKEINIYYFRDAEGGGMELADHVNFIQQYTVDEEGNWKQK